MAGIQWRCLLTADQYVGLGKLYYRDKRWAQNKEFSSRAQGRISKTNKLRGFLKPRIEKKVDMNRTPFDCGIMKSTETREGEKFHITSVLPKSVNLPKPVECEICKESFAAKKYLDSHVRWKHGGDVNFKSKPVSTPSYTESKEISNSECTLVLDDLDAVDTRKHQVTKPDSRKGSSRRKSYTVDSRQRLLNV